MIRLSITPGKGSKMQIIVSLCLEVNLLSQAILLIQFTKMWLRQCVPSCKDTLDTETTPCTCLEQHLRAGLQTQHQEIQFSCSWCALSCEWEFFSLFLYKELFIRKLKQNQRSKFLQPVCLNSLHTWSKFRKGSVKKLHILWL